MINRCCISISENCNMSCRYCHFSIKDKRRNEMNESELVKVIQNIKRYIHENDVDIFKIGIVGGGEPLIHFNILKKLVDTVKSTENIKLYTISNGYSVSEKQLKYFYDNRDTVTLNFSLDGYKEIHDLNRIDCLGNGTFDRVMESIEKYEGIFSQKPQVNCTVTSEHIKNHEKVIDFFVRHGFETVTFSQVFDSPEYSTTNEEFGTFLNDASKFLTLRQKRTTNSYDCSKYGKLCGVGITNPYFSGGDVYPCGRFSGLNTYRLGSAADPLNVIEEKMKELRHVSRKSCYYDMLQKECDL